MHVILERAHQPRSACGKTVLGTILRADGQKQSGNRHGEQEMVSQWHESRPRQGGLLACMIYEEFSLRTER